MKTYGIRWRKGIALAALSGALLAGGAAQNQVTVQANPHYDRRMTVAEEELPGVSSEEVQSAEVSENAWKKINGVCYNGSGEMITGAITRGIDVSEWQGEINWSQVKQAGIDFAFVRLFHGTGYTDKMADTNLTHAEAAGVPTGTYVYSTATTASGALQEAKLAIEKMQGHKISYPVVFDMEYSGTQWLSASDKAQLALTFCNEVKKAGYYPMVYCNTYWYDTQIDWSSLSGLDVWIARYGDRILAPDASRYSYTIWQSTDGAVANGLNSTKGLIPGIPVWNDVDVDFGYVNYGAKITPRWKAKAGYSPSAFPDLTAITARQGWYHTQKGNDYYYVKNSKVTGWQEIDGKYYFFDRKSGALHKDELFKDTDGKIYYVDKEGVRVCDKWIIYNGKRYYLGKEGYAGKALQRIDGKYYYFHTREGFMYTNKKVIRKDGSIYYFGPTGAACTNGMYDIKSNGKTDTYYFRKNGKANVGWVKYKGKRYYFYEGRDKKAGTMAKNVSLQGENGITSVFDEDGVCIRRYKTETD